MMKCIFLTAGIFVFQIALSQNVTESNLPLILINTQGKSIPDETKITALMKVINNPDTINRLTDKTFEYDGYVGIETRGNTSQLLFEKKSFTIETRTDSGTNKNVTLLGMPAENDWVLYGPYSDKTMIRNVLAYHLGHSQGRWSPRTHYCEVFINEEYRGVYVLTEKIKIDKNRVDIAKLKPEDNDGDELTGGYIMRIDRDRPGSWNSPFMGRTGSVDVPISYLDPAYDELTLQQRQYIRDYITDFEYALHGQNFKDLVLGYRAYIDVISFVDYFIVTEISRDLDGYRCSVYFHKDKDSKGGKLNMSPLWDYNLGFGNGNFFQAQNTIGWTADGIGKGDWYEIPFWWDRLREDPYFNTCLKYRWNELRNNAFHLDSIFDLIDSCAGLLDKAQKRNFQKFNILNSYVWPNPYIGGSYYNEVEHLKEWIADRLDWLDTKMDLIIPVTVNEHFADYSAGTDQVVLYPNPVNEKLIFHLNLAEYSKIEVFIFNSLGKIVACRKQSFNLGISELVFDANELDESGNIFFYTLYINGALSNSGKIIRKAY
ncbi:MAG: CotH kinase family protein [Bacteroidales bacterium]|nr:CotH kinase family protein [Bacteroidales bacterium]